MPTDKQPDTDYSGWPVRALKPEEIAKTETTELPAYDVIVILENGTEAAKIGELYYPLKKNGKPDFDRPIHAPK